MERHTDTPISGPVLSIQAQKLPNDHVDKPGDYIYIALNIAMEINQVGLGQQTQQKYT